jgi:hypothetical protein
MKNVVPGPTTDSNVSDPSGRSTTARAIDEHVVVAITDSGSGIPSEDPRPCLRSVLHHEGCRQGRR